jgi:hypothetical protein
MEGKGKEQAESGCMLSQTSVFVEKPGQGTGACSGICMGNPISWTNFSRALGELQLLNELKIAMQNQC